MRIFIDDVRKAPPGWELAKFNSSAIRMIDCSGERVTHISFDHDHGDDERGFRPAVEFLIREIKAGRFKDVKITIHSANPVGAKWIQNQFKDINVDARIINYRLML